MSHAGEKRLVVIAGPCVAESYDVAETVAEKMISLSEKLGFEYIFKSSYDKANRTSLDSYRGPGMEKALGWFDKLKKTYNFEVLSDIHAVDQVAVAAEVCDHLQIPAFLCRQTDIIVAAVKSGRGVNIKKGQFVSPEAMANSVEKALETARRAGIPPKVMVTERGTSLGYGNLVVDMRSFPILSESQVPVIFDITHSTQLPSLGGGGKVSSAQRRFAPVLARAAAASGYVDGFFLEVHPDPSKAKCDAEAQVTPDQAEILLSQLILIWQQAMKFKNEDGKFSG